MTIFKGEVGTEIRIDVGIDISDATLLQIVCRKPSGNQVTWNATQYEDTTEIIYTVGEGDLDEVGDYELRPYVEFGSTSKQFGEIVTLEVIDPTDSKSGIDKIITAFNIYYRFFTVQKKDEYNSNINNDADIPYNAFVLYKELAEDELVNLLNARSVPVNYLTSVQYDILICHLIADYFERGNPDYSFRSQSQAPGVSFTRGADTGPRLAIEKILESIEAAYRRDIVSGGRGSIIQINRISDAKKYPARWKRTDIPSLDMSDGGFDASDVSDFGE